GRRWRRAGPVAGGGFRPAVALQPARHHPQRRIHGPGRRVAAMAGVAGMSAGRIEELLDIMARLRDPEGGCPWDVRQTFATIAPYTVEEAYEVADAIDRDDMGDLRDELGDLLLQVVFHARMAEEQGAFAFADVVAAIGDKMLRRHPHVFAGASVESVEAQAREWEEYKRRERADAGNEDTSALAGIARGMPEWQRATKLQKRA